MIKLDPTTISELITLLKPIMEGEEERRTLLFRAFGNLNSLGEQIDCRGTTGTFIPRLLQKLANYGEVEPGREALYILLETIKQQNLVGLREQERIDSLLRQFNQSRSIQSQYFQGKGSRYQDLSTVTVGIRNHTNSLVGTGILVKGKILTLGRVITASGALPEGRVNVFLPKTNRGGSRSQQATIECSFPERQHNLQDDDIVVLSLINGTLASETVRVENARQSVGNQFRIYGFTGLNEQPSDYINGEIVGFIECPIEVDPQINCFKLLPDGTIHSAMTGSGVLDLARNFIVGLVARPNYFNSSSMAFGGDIIQLEPICTTLNP